MNAIIQINCALICIQIDDAPNVGNMQIEWKGQILLTVLASEGRSMRMPIHPQIANIVTKAPQAMAKYTQIKLAPANDNRSEMTSSITQRDETMNNIIPEIYTAFN